MEIPAQTPNNKNEEVSIKDIILRIREWRRFLLGKWLVILLFAGAGAGLGLFLSLKGKVNYVGELTFVLEDGKSGSMGAYAGIASQFGLDLGGGGSGMGVFSGDNIMAFLTSRLMVEKALLSAVKVNGQEISLADLYIDINELREDWKSPSLKNIHLSDKTPRTNFTVQQDSIMNVLYQQIIKKNLKVDKPDKKLSFISVKCTSRNELFSKLFTERLVKEATRFYVDTKTQRSKTSVDALQAKADSLQDLMNKRTYSAAASQDLNQNPARRIAMVSTELATRDKVMLQTVYGEVIKNLEMSKMAQAQETPIIQIIDLPILPLKKERLGKLKGIVIGGFLGGFLIILFLLYRKIMKEIML